jgi:hypothetical protein
VLEFVQMPARKGKYSSQEVIVLGKLIETGFSDQLISQGNTDGGHAYLILTKYGLDLRQMLKESKYERFSIKTTV